MLETDIAQHPEMRAQVDEIVVELDHMLHAAAGRGEDALDVLERLLGLGAEVARRADQLVVDVEALLPGDVEDAAGRGRLDRLGVGAVLRAGRRVEIAEVPRAVGLRARLAPRPRR